MKRLQMSQLIVSLVLVGVLHFRALAQVAPGGEVPSPSGADGNAVRALATSLSAVQESQEKVAARVTKVAAELQTLRQEVAAIVVKPAQPPQDDPAKPKAPQQVKFRPPLERETDLQPMIVVCESGTLTLLDTNALTEAVKRLGAAQLKEGQEVTYPGSAFRFVFHLGQGRMEIEVLRKTGPEGRGVACDPSDKAALQKFLQSIDRSKNYPDFTVYPDAYPLFRRAREVAWEQKYEVDWSPVASGKKIKLYSGAGGGTVQ
jgi:hypothetical protein